MHAALLDYLSSDPSFSESAKAFSREAEASPSPPVATSTGREKGLLVKKWTSIVRLSKQVTDLQKQVADLQATAKASSAENSAPQGGDSRTTAPGIGGGGGRSMIPLSQPALGSLRGHRDTVTCVRAHPVFSLVASASDDGVVKVWDVESLKLERSLKGHTKAVNHLAFDPQGNVLATCSSDLTLKLWDFSTTSGGFPCMKTLSGHDHTVSGVAFLPEGGQLVSSSRDGTLKVWEVGTGYCVRTVDVGAEAGKEWVRCVDASSDGQWLACGCDDHAVRVLPLQQLGQGASGAGGGGASAWQELRHHEHNVQAVAFSRRPVDLASSSLEEDSQQAAAGPGATKEGETGGPKGAVLLASGGRDSVVCVWNVHRGQLLMTLRDHSNWVNDLAWMESSVPGSGGGGTVCRLLASCSDDRSIKVHDLSKRGRLVRSLDDAHAHFVTSVSPLHGLGRLVSAGVDKELRVWECR